MNPIHLVAMGNPVMSDDGAGPLVLEALAVKKWPAPVIFHNTGTVSLAYSAMLREPGRIIIVDALCGGRPPGTVSRTRADSLCLRSDTAFSLHDLHLLHLTARFYPHRLTDIQVFGIEPLNLNPGLTPSAAVSRTLPLLTRAVSRQIMRYIQPLSPSLSHAKTKGAI
ncbi:MAG: hydrogenase maturation protease [Bacillota bacterium]|nr:hydrogenase maturation protease [Bacillota bacterium]MDW7682505.1 hydrogenase maturation protease [Bacillota bacterium]